jgi:hypothetical protein
MRAAAALVREQEQLTAPPWIGPDMPSVFVDHENGPSWPGPSWPRADWPGAGGWPPPGDG